MKKKNSEKKNSLIDASLTTRSCCRDFYYYELLYITIHAVATKIDIYYGRTLIFPFKSRRRDSIRAPAYPLVRRSVGWSVRW